MLRSLGEGGAAPGCIKSVILQRTPRADANPLAPNRSFRLTFRVSDRLKDLQRQQALAKAQAAALEREIAKEMGTAAPPPAAPAPSGTPTSSGVDSQADQIIEQYSQNQRPIHDQVRSGCLVYFFAAFGLVGLGLIALYFYGHH